jgi:Ca2+-binding RTX toxin-like protein
MVPVSEARKLSNLGVTDLDNLGNRIDGLELPPGSVKFGNVITCRAMTTCIGTNNDDIIMAGIGEQVFGRKGNDMLFGALGDQLYGDDGDDIILLGAGNSLGDGGSGDDVLKEALGHSLLVGTGGNDKLLA